MQVKSKVIIEFDNEDAAKEFACWLDGQGEQDYWQWRDCQDEQEAYARHFKHRKDTLDENNVIIEGHCKK